MSFSVRTERAESLRAIHEQIMGGSVGEFTVELLTTVAPALVRWVQNDFGRQSTGRAVAGRDTTEDVEIEIDRKAEHYVTIVTERLAKKYNLSFTILSEHNNFEITNGERHLTMVLDPFENSDEYKRRLPTPPFSHFQIYNHKNKPLAAGASNLATGEIYLAIYGTNYRFHPQLNRLEKIPDPVNIRSIKDGDVALASYDGKFKYSSLFDEYFTGLKKDLEINKGSFHGKGGSHSYIDLANGAIGSYIMFDEPRGEIDPAYLFALQAGCRVVSVDLETGEYRDYEFDPSLQRERVPFLIAARSEELIKEIVGYYLKAKNQEAA